MNKGLGQLLEMIRQSQALQEPENQKSTASSAGGGSTSSAPSRQIRVESHGSLEFPRFDGRVGA
jgi:hypothetical protein